MNARADIPSAADEATETSMIFALARDLKAANEQLVLRSVLDQESAESAEEGRAQLNALVEALSEGIVIADASGKLVMMNRAACAILGVAEWSLLSVTDAARLDLRDAAGVPFVLDDRPIVRALRGEKFVDTAIQIVHPDEEARDLLASGTSITDGGRVVLAIVVFRDVTEVRKLERQRDEYVALVSHDIRGPLSSIMLLADSLKAIATQEGLSPRVTDHVSRIAKNAWKISSMVTELLEGTGIESTSAAARSVSIDLEALIRGAVELLADGSRGRVRFEPAVGGDCRVRGEPGRIERAFGNLLSNALKYSPGDVELRLESSGRSAVITVVDHGGGIASQDLRHVFDRYYRAEAGRRIGHGFGLGLYITRLIAEAHGGRAEAQSELGVGSAFRLILPLDAAAGAERAEPVEGV